jgi:hypothetical protein
VGWPKTISSGHGLFIAINLVSSRTAASSLTRRYRHVFADVAQLMTTSALQLDLSLSQPLANRRPWTNRPEVHYVVSGCGNKSSSSGVLFRVLQTTSTKPENKSLNWAPQVGGYYPASFFPVTCDHTAASVLPAPSGCLSIYHSAIFPSLPRASVYLGNEPPNIGFPLLDCCSAASS